ncbi:HEAT repeat domain-containing protein [Tengunoibacter tsumagoiensis]|uniref:HEAT repeat domain-containing protein n=1 Tax=Tengunoibacter tsumagoiensis TaxID=2014871 RepID=A0A402A7M8_9CHLR|nr:HEAT repeat domain-containing protein [Tengunoibacter tsumagoiensis]GCE14996.1 hypothetical protein KTT_48550 [Tengunoibacter tsumagoiensis]
MNNPEEKKYIQATKSEDSSTRIEALYTLNELEYSEIAPLLLHLLSTDPDKDVRAEAAFLLRSLGHQSSLLPTVGPPLLAALTDGDEKVRNNAAETLGFLQYEVATGPLQNLLKADPFWFVRSSAAEALGRLGDPGSIPALLHASSDSELEVQRSAIQALGQFLHDPKIAPFVTSALLDEKKDPLIKAELSSLSYRLGHQSHLYALLALLSETNDYEFMSNVLMILSDLVEKSSLFDLTTDQEGIHSTLQDILHKEPSLHSDIERITQMLPSYFDIS